MSRIYLSPPDVGTVERALLLDAFDSNWIAPVGAHVDAFEEEVAALAGLSHGLALSSGTAGLHLAMLLLGVGPGDEVIVPTLTFVATANAVSYVGATPQFIDADEKTWCLDPALLAEELRERAARGALPKAVITVDLYGQCADYDAILAVCATYDVPVVEDAAEALGATYGDRPAGSFGRLGVFSFNGNKIATTSGGGMIVSADGELIARARHLATQAKDDSLHYEHSMVGYNYRLSNLLAAVGRGQLRDLDTKISRRCAINQRYRDAFADEPGIGFPGESPLGRSNHWLTVITVEPDEFGVTPADISRSLDLEDIEARPAWKPMHLQPIYAGAPVRGGAVSEHAFATGLCLPSGSSLTPDEQDRVIDAVKRSRLSTARAASGRS